LHTLMSLYPAACNGRLFADVSAPDGFARKAMIEKK